MYYGRIASHIMMMYVHFYVYDSGGLKFKHSEKGDVLVFFNGSKADVCGEIQRWKGVLDAAVEVSRAQLSALDD